MQLKVIDISHWNTVTDFNAVKAAGYDFVSLKVSQGISSQEGQKYDIRSRCELIKKAGLLIQYYAFCEPGVNADPLTNASLEIMNFKSATYPLLKNDLPHAADVEQWVKTILWKSNIKDGMELYIKTFIKALGVDAMLYSYKSFLDTNLNHDHKLGNIPLWLAGYIKNPILPIGWDNYKTWQFTNQGIVPGCVGNVDLDILNI
jgi:GH25 family lysozyme M1 (1,4-beta-N-acetylmuramidase)